MNKVEFFQQEDLQLIKNWANRPYDGSDHHQEIGEKLKQNPWTKTKYWCQKVANNTGLQYEVYRMWLTQGQKFKPYTWAKIYDDESWTKEIFFTVGINEGAKKPFFHIKIDYQFESPKELTVEQDELCRKLTRDDGNYRYEKRIYPSEIEEYDWERLIEESQNFIENHLSTYYEIVGEVGQLSLATKERSKNKLSKNTRNRSSSRVISGRRTGCVYQIRRQHDEISECLESYLQENIGNNESVDAERLVGNKPIDIVHEKPNKFIYYEIKTYRKLNYCVREGLGQLLEYAFWNTAELSKPIELILVSKHKPTQVLKEYIRKLQNEFGLPIHYQQFDLDENKLGKLI